MASEIRANKSTNRAGLGTVTYADTGIIVSGIVTCTELSGLSALNISGVGTANTLDINGDIDVDGHTNLDNVSIAGVSTFSGNVTISKQNAVIELSDPDSSDANYQIRNDNGTFDIKDSTNSTVKIRAAGSYVTVFPNLNANNGLDVMGTITGDGNLDIANSVRHSGDTDTKISFDTNIIHFDTDNTERVRITSAGRVLIGHNTQSSDLHGPQTTNNRAPFFQLHGANAVSAGAALISWKNQAGSYYAPTLYLAHSGSDTIGTNGVLPSSGEFGSIVFSGDDGTDFVKGAMIKARLDGTPGNDDMPGRLEFHTTPDGAQVPVERLTITKDGNIRAKTATQYKVFTLVKADGGTVAQLVGHATDNDEGGLNLWDGGVKKIQILAQGTSYLNGGNIGIGINDPDSLLETVSSATNGINAHIGGLYSDGGQSAVRRIEFGVKNYRNAIQSQQGSGGNNFTSNNDLLLNPSGGNIGIGTNNALDNLHILGTNPGILITDSNGAADTKNWSITAGVSQILRIQAQNDSNAGGGNIFDFYRVTNQVNEFRGVNSGNTWFVIDNLNKRVGINTDIAGTTLDIFGILQVKDTTGKQNLHVSNTSFKYSQSSSGWTNMDYASNPILGWDYKSGPGDLMYMASGGNTATADQMALVISDSHGFKVGKSGYDGTDMDVDSNNEFFRIKTDGNVLINTSTINNGGSDPKLSIDGGNSNIGVIQVQAGGGENTGDLAGISFSHGNTGEMARPKAAIAFNRNASYGRGDLCFYVDNTSDNNSVSSADLKLNLTKSGQLVVQNGNIDFNTAGTGIFYNPGGNDAAGITFQSNELRFYTQNTHRFSLDTSGYLRFQQQLFIRNNAPTIYLQDTDHHAAMIHQNSNLFYILRASGTDSTNWVQYNNHWPLYISMTDNRAYFGGNVYSTGTLLTGSSDLRLKKNLVKIQTPLEKISKLTGYNFDWNDNVTELGFTPDIPTNDVGLIAQDVQEVAPQAVQHAPFDKEYDKETETHKSRSGEKYLTVQYEKLVPLLVEAIKELKAEVDALKSS